LTTEENFAYLQYRVIYDWLYLFGGDVWMVLPIILSSETLQIGSIILERLSSAEESV
jgi:hypothetical protein